jgi:hypothetical protein
MTSLIINLSTGKGTWAQVSRVVSAEDWEKIYFITNQFGAQKFSTDKESEYILIENTKPVDELSEHIRNSLDGKIKDLEVAVNISSGTGNEHMAIISAVLKLGLGLRLVYVDQDRLVDL